MKDKNERTESHQDRISRKADDGGGCTEMWEALSSERQSKVVLSTGENSLPQLVQ